jgi:hypothetical protein
MAFIVMMELARRHVCIEYERRQIGDRIIEKQPSTLALKLNGAWHDSGRRCAVVSQHPVADHV